MAKPVIMGNRAHASATRRKMVARRRLLAGAPGEGDSGGDGRAWSGKVAAPCRGGRGDCGIRTILRQGGGARGRGEGRGRRRGGRGGEAWGDYRGFSSFDFRVSI